MNKKASAIALILAALFLATIMMNASSWSVEKQKIERKYLICFLYPKTEITEGVLDEETFDHNFTMDCVMCGARLTPPAGSPIDGFLVVSDKKRVITLPIVHWDGQGGKKIYLCQGGNEFGKAPIFSIVAESRDEVISQIRKRMRGEDKWW